MRRIHIVSVSPRAGTTLLAECMRVSFEIDAYEPHEARLSKCRWRTSVFLTKRPGDIVDVGPRLRVDPRLTVICMMRDPRDVIVSRHGKAPDLYYVPLRIWKQRVAYMRRLSKHPRFLVVRYEDLVRDPNGVQQRLMRALPFLRFRAPFNAFGNSVEVSRESDKALGGVRSIAADRTGTWRRHPDRVLGQLVLHGAITDELIEFGYEADDSWLKELARASPDLSPSFAETPRRFGRGTLRAIKARLHAGRAFSAWVLGLSWG
jgi:hypothetical protein